MTAEPSSADIFASLCKDGSPKFIKSLERIKATCDHIVAAKGPISYAQVGAVATKLFGGPKAQSIHNNPDHKRYIDARQREYRGGPIGASSTAERATRNREYPAADLDFKTRRYIDDLRQRNDMLEAAMREFREQIARATQETPVDIANLLGAGPAADGSMIVPVVATPAESNQLSPLAVVAIRHLLFDLPKLSNEVEAYKGKALRLRSGDWLLPPDQYAELLKLISLD